MAQSVTLPVQTIFKDARLSWEGRKLIFSATFNTYGHEMPIYLEWHPKGAARGEVAEIDTIEQFGRGMPLKVTLISLEKNPAGQAVVYMGQPAPNSPRLDGDDAVNLDARMVMTDADTGETDAYSFSLTRAGADALPRVSVSR